MSKLYHTAIIGGGAAGLMTAVELLLCDNKLNGKDIIIIEKNDRVGKKLIATGNGQGNLTNANFGEEFYYGEKEFIASFIEKAKKIDIKDYLDNLGIPLYEGVDGKIYPLSRQASSVLDIIRANLLANGVTEKVSSQVKSIKKQGETYQIETINEQIKAKTVVVAVGGASAKQFGTDGSAYKLLTAFGHKCSEIYPSLVQLKTNLDNIRGLKGLKEIAKVTAIYKDKPIKSAVGDLLFTEFGVSGSAIFNISSSIVDKDKVKLKIEFVPSLDQQEIENILKKRQKLEYLSKGEPFVGIINKRVGMAVAKSAKSLLPNDLAYALKNFYLSVTGNLGFNYSQVTKGGILTGDIDKETMESKLSKGLYAVGEVLDIDGDCGGYNLTFAFVSGIIAGRAIKSKSREKDYE